MTGSIHSDTEHILMFVLDDQVFALPLRSVVKVIHSVEIRNLPKVPEVILGIINVRGKIIAVADLRRRFGMKHREIGISDQFIIADTGKREIALVVDTVSGISIIDPKEINTTKNALPFAEHISGVAKINDTMVLIYDLEKFLSIDEEADLNIALIPISDES